jgi:porin
MRPEFRPLGLAALLAIGLASAPLRAEEVAECKDAHALLPGLCLGADALADGFANLRGGAHRGLAATARLGLQLEADLDALAGLSGWRFGASAFGVYGRQPGLLSGSLAVPSNAEALSSIRLNEVWLQKEFEGIASLRIGQLAVDSEFATADAAENLINATFGWPVGLSENLPSGGVAYPFAAPGIRLALGEPEKASGVRLGLFSGDPGGRYGADTDPQRHNRYGTNPSFAGGAFMIAEAVLGAEAPEGSEGPRPWVAKLGYWRHTGGFDSQRRDEMGLSLADPGSTGTPRRFGRNQGGYGIGEVTLWRGTEQSLAAFARGFVAPADRNLIAFQADAGLAWKGPFGRSEDAVSLGLSQARAGHSAKSLDRDRRRLGEDVAIRDYEMAVEANYDAALMEGKLHLQPVAQWIRHPGAGATQDDGRALRNALLLGMRVQASF